MDAEKVKANEKRFFGFVNERDTEAIEEWIDTYVAEDFVNHSPDLDVPGDREGLKEMFRRLFQLAPGFTMMLKEMAFENDLLAFRYFIHGVGDKDPIMGMAMVRFKDKKIAERWSLTEA